MKKLGRKALALSLTVVMGTSMLLTGCGSGSTYHPFSYKID